jgi:hypothetical protein
MCEIVPQNSAFRFFDKAELVKLKKRAVRSGVWFKALRRIDRVLIDLTMKVAGDVRSITLAKRILALIRKLEGIMESSLSRALREAGLPLAQKLSLLAQQWGNTSAKRWASTFSFVNFLAVMYINDPKTFKA